MVLYHLSDYGYTFYSKYKMVVYSFNFHGICKEKKKDKYYRTQNNIHAPLLKTSSSYVKLVAKVQTIRWFLLSEPAKNTYPNIHINNSKVQCTLRSGLTCITVLLCLGKGRSTKNLGQNFEKESESLWLFVTIGTVSQYKISLRSVPNANSAPRSSELQHNPCLEESM